MVTTDLAQQREVNRQFEEIDKQTAREERWKKSAG
jgi:hypothetical protein